MIFWQMYFRAEPDCCRSQHQGHPLVVGVPDCGMHGRVVEANSRAHDL